MKKYILHLPINSVSFGQTGTLILRTILDNPELESECQGLFLIGDGADLSSQPKDFNEKYGAKIQALINKSIESYKRETPVLKLWHLNGSLESLSANPSLLTFHELDSPTTIECAIAKSQNTIFTSEYTCSVFEASGVKTNFVPMAFDSYNFNQKSVKRPSGRIVFNILGKYEKRKSHEKMIRAWVKKYGNNSKYALQCATYNPHFPNAAETNNAITQQVLEGKTYFNVMFFGHMKQNSLYNDFLNSADIVLAMSGGEGWGLPEFHSVAIGKHAVVLNAHGYKGWADKDNAVLISPNGKEPAYDGMFFHPGAPFNQGNIFTFDEDDFISGCEEAIKRVEANRVNESGLLLQNKFTKEAFVRNLIGVL